MPLEFTLPSSVGWFFGAVVLIAMVASLRKRANLHVESMLSMPSPSDATHSVESKILPENVQSLIREGRTVEAIKALRETTGMDLTRAHSAVKEWRSDDGSMHVRQHVEVYSSGELPPEILELVQAGETIEATRRLRQEYGVKTGDAVRAVKRVSQSSAHAADFNSPENNPLGMR